MVRTSSVLLLLACFIGGRLLPAEEAKAPAEMTTKVLKLPFNLMELGLATEPEPGSPDRPVDPFAAPAPFAASPSPPVLTFKTSRKILEDLGITFPPGASAIFDPVKRELTLHHTPEMQELTEGFISTILYHGPNPTVAFTVTVVGGPGEVIRQANAAASRHADAMPQLEALLAEAAKPGSGVQVVGEMFLEEKQGTRATGEAVLERPQVEVLRTTAAPAATPTPPKTPPPQGDETPETKPPSWTRQDGMSLALESWPEEDGKMMSVTLSLHLGPSPPAMQDDPAKTADTEPAPGLRKASIVTATRMTSGSAKLIGITRPIGKDAALKEAGKDRLWAAFLTARVRRVRPPPGVIATPWMAQEKLPPGMRAVAFQAPEGLLETAAFQEEMVWRTVESPRARLEALGVTFPAGASLEHRDGLLQVVNTPENIEGIAAAVDHAWAKAFHNVAFTLHTFQVPARLMRPLVQQGTARENADDSALLAAVEAATARGEARAVSSAFFESKNGVLTRHESGLVQSYMTRFGTTPSSGQSELGFHRQAVGTMLEIEPMVSADGRTMNLEYTLELHPAPPASHREHLRAAAALMDHDLPGSDVQVLRAVTATVMASGTTRLLSLYGPTLGASESAHAADPFGAPAGHDAEMLWATFLQAQVVPQVRKPPPPIKPQMPKAQADAQHIVDKMNKIIIPVVKFEGVSTQKALEFLQARSRELDTSTEVDAEKGVNIILLEDEMPHETAIFLDLLDVPMSEALRYVTELGQCTYRVKANGVQVIHRHTVADELHTRSYRVPKDFLTLMEAPATPAANAPKARKSAKQVLESQGITFPEGASAFYSANTTQLLVRNTQPNLDLVEAFLDTRCRWYAAPVALTAQVLQGPGPLLRRIAAQAAPLNDHHALLDELLAAVKAGTVQALDTARIETRSGTRSTAEQGHDVAALARLTLDGKGGASLGHEPLFSGLHLEAEPTVSSDGNRFDLTLAAEFHTAPPALRQEHLIDEQGRRFDLPLTDTHRASLVTALTLLDGNTRLLHLWKPTGTPEFEKEDVLQVMFITCDVLRPEE